MKQMYLPTVGHGFRKPFHMLDEQRWVEFCEAVTEKRLKGARRISLKTIATQLGIKDRALSKRFAESYVRAYPENSELCVLAKKW